MAASVNLLPPEHRGDKWRPRVIACIAVGLVVLALAVWTAALASQAAHLRHQVADVRSQTAQFGSALDQYQALKKLEEQLAAASASSGKPAIQRSAAMREAQTLARDVALTGVAVTGDGQVVITGQAAGLPTLAAYLERLGGSQVLTAPTLNSAVVAEAPGQLQFEIACRLAEGGGK